MIQSPSDKGIEYFKTNLKANLSINNHNLTLIIEFGARWAFLVVSHFRRLLFLLK
jgi:hypothetical protein